MLFQVSKRGRLHDVFYRQKHPQYEQLKHCIGKTKTNHVVLQTLSTTFQFQFQFNSNSSLLDTCGVGFGNGMEMAFRIPSTCVCSMY